MESSTIQQPERSSGPHNNAVNKVQVCYDMETQDPDDFLCLLFLASHPRVRLKAVTLVPGSEQQIGLVRWALQQLGLSDVAIGAGYVNSDRTRNLRTSAALLLC